MWSFWGVDCGTSLCAGTLHAHEDKKLWPEAEVDVLPLNTTHPLALNILRQATLWSNFVKFG